MDAKQKRELEAHKETLDNSRDIFSNALSSIHDILNEVEETYEALSDKQKESEKGIKLEATKEALQEAIDALSEIDDKISDIDTSLTTATE